MALPISGLTLTYNEDFNSVQYAGNSKVTTGSNTWNTTLSGGVRSLNGNGEKQWYMDPGYRGLGVNPFSVNNGILTIQGAKASPEVKSQIWGYNYTSGALTTQNQFSQQYGYFEVRAKTPAGGKGFWPAFWMMPSKGGWPPELDVMEQIGSAPFYLLQGIHSSNGNRGLGANTPNNNTQAFHTYGMDWTKEKTTFYYDGVKRAEFATPADANTPMYMILNLAIGGNWPGSPDSTTDWSKADYQIDYVRAYQHTGTSTPIPTPTPTPNPTTPTPGPSSSTAPGMSPDHVVLSNTMMDVSDLRDSYRPANDVTRTYTASQMAIDGVKDPTTVSVSYSSMRDITVTNNGAWGAIRNAILKSGDVRNVTVNNFVDAEISLGDTPRVIAVSGAKRGNIRTGAGSDTITVSAKSDTNDINLMTINAGDGNNRVSFSGASNTRVNATTGTGIDTLTSSGQAFSTLNAGAGDDRINTRTSSMSSVTGGTGRDVFSFMANAHATITDFKSADDRIELSGVRAGDVRVSSSSGSTFIDLGNSGRITVAGVTQTQSDLKISYV
jgi:beta-glucanase (GH16 family)